jgi:hypothetical protein
MPMKVKMQGLPPYVEPEPKAIIRIKPEDDPFDHNDEYAGLLHAMGVTEKPEKKVEVARVPGIIGKVMPRHYYVALAKGTTIVFPPEPTMNVKSSDGTEKLYIFRRVPTLEDLKVAAGVARELFPEATKIKALVGRHKVDNIPSVDANIYACTTAVVVVCPTGSVSYSELTVRRAIMITTMRALDTLVTSQFDLELKMVDESVNIDTDKLLGVGF